MITENPHAGQDCNLSDKTKMSSAALVDAIYYSIELRNEKADLQEIFEMLVELRRRFLFERLKAVTWVD